MSSQTKISLTDIAERFSLPLEGDGGVEIERLCGLSDNLENALSFVANDKLRAEAQGSSIPAFIVRPGAALEGKVNLFHESPDYAISRVATLFQQSPISFEQLVHPSAIIHETASIGENVKIGPNAVIGANVSIGDNTVIFPNVVLMDDVSIGQDCQIFPQCMIGEDCQIGDRAVLHAGVKIGGDGYGFAQYKNENVKTPQLGNVIIESDVEIGSNSTIDRGRFTATLIGAGSKIDNLVMVAHNVQIGKNCLLVSQCGVSGSAVLGDSVTLAGQVGLVGHIKVADNVTFLGQSMATKDVREAGVWAGSPARPAALWKKAVAAMYSNLNKKR